MFILYCGKKPACEKNKAENVPETRIKIWRNIVAILRN